MEKEMSQSSEIGFSSRGVSVTGGDDVRVLRPIADLIAKWLSENGIFSLYAGARINCVLGLHKIGNTHRARTVLYKGKADKGVKVLAQPAGNETCWEVIVPPPPGYTCDKFAAELVQLLEGESANEPTVNPVLLAYDGQREAQNEALEGERGTLAALNQTRTRSNRALTEERVKLANLEQQMEFLQKQIATCKEAVGRREDELQAVNEQIAASEERTRELSEATRLMEEHRKEVELLSPRLISLSQNPAAKKAILEALMG